MDGMNRKWYYPFGNVDVDGVANSTKGHDEKNEDKFNGIDVKFETDRFWVQDRAYQLSFSCCKSCADHHSQNLRWKIIRETSMVQDRKLKIRWDSK